MPPTTGKASDMKYVVNADAWYTTIEQLEDDEYEIGLSWQEAKEEALAEMTYMRDEYAAAVRRLRNLTKAEVDRERSEHELRI